MITISQLQDLLGNLLFNGDAGLAGMIMFVIILSVIFVVLKRNVYASLIVAIPVAFISSMIGLVSVDLVMILIVVCVFGLVVIGKRAMGD